MKRLSLVLVVAASLALPAAAIAGASTTGAAHAVTRAIGEEGRTAVNVHCRRLSRSRITCSFFALYYRNGHVTVTYSHGHYYVGEPRYEVPPEYIPVPRPPEPQRCYVPGC